MLFQQLTRYYVKKVIFVIISGLSMKNRLSVKSSPAFLCLEITLFYQVTEYLSKKSFFLFISGLSVKNCLSVKLSPASHVMQLMKNNFFYQVT